MKNDEQIKNVVLWKSLKILTIVIAIPFYFFVSILPVCLFPFVALIIRCHNEFNKYYPIKLKMIYFGVIEKAEYQTFSGWIKSYSCGIKNDNVITIMTGVQGIMIVYTICQFLMAYCVGNLIIEGIIMLLK